VDEAESRARFAATLEALMARVAGMVADALG
jgi:hypothetical protein